MVVDDDEYKNAVAAHAAFVMTVSAARMYWLLRHAQHSRDMNIHKLHPLPEKMGLGSADFLHSATGYIQIAVFVLFMVALWNRADHYIFMLWFLLLLLLLLLSFFFFLA